MYINVLHIQVENRLFILKNPYRNYVARFKKINKRHPKSLAVFMWRLKYNLVHNKVRTIIQYISQKM